MRKRLRRRVAQDRPDAIVLDARAETLAVQDASFDTVVASFVLCSVDDQTAVLDEIARAAASRSAALPRTHARRGSEDREETGRPAVPLLLDGASEPSHLDAITASKLSVVGVRRGAVPKASVIEPPMVVGRATRSAG